MSDAAFIEKTLAGDQSAFRILVERHQGMVYTIALRILKDKEDAEEVAQDTFVKAYQKLETFQGGSKFSTWLYSIVYNTAISRTRKKRLAMQDVKDLGDHAQLATSNKEQLTEMGRGEQRKYLELAMAELPGTDAAVISLYYLEEQSVEEVGEATGLSKSNVKVKLHRGRQRLQVELERLLKSEARTLVL